MSWLYEPMIQQQLQQQQVGEPACDLLISIPYKERFSSAWVRSIIELQRPASTIIAFETGQPIDISRNIAVTKALQTGAKHLFCLDSDVILHVDDINHLLGLRLPFVSGIYRSRGEPYHILANIDDKPVNDDVLNQDITRVHEVGLGCALIDTRIFKIIGSKLDWRCMIKHTAQIGKDVAIFDGKTAKDNHWKCNICNNTLIAKFFRTTIGMENKNPLSEDYYFCKLVRDNGFPIVITPRVIGNHESTFLIVDGKTGKLINSLGSVANVK